MQNIGNIISDKRIPTLGIVNFGTKTCIFY